VGEAVGADGQRGNETSTGGEVSDTEHETLSEDPTEPEPQDAPETDGEPNPDAEPAEEIEGDDDGEPVAPVEGDDDAEARAVQSEKALAERDKKIDAENARHAKRVGEIMDESAVDLIPCPVCMDGIAGWVYSPEVQQLSDEAVLRLRQLIGLSGLEGIKQATFATRCPDCDGHGEVTTGSRVHGYETTTCERCLKAGWIRVGSAPTNGHVEIEPEQVVTGPTVYQADPDDVEIKNLRERGFTVIPPLTVPNG
jgi:hypothetical protein